MTRQNLEQAICDLEYLVINHFDNSKVDEYAQDLRHYSEELRALDAAERYTAQRRFLCEPTTKVICAYKSRAHSAAHSMSGMRIRSWSGYPTTSAAQLGLK